jgi:hypothetical protein
VTSVAIDDADVVVGATFRRGTVLTAGEAIAAVTPAIDGAVAGIAAQLRPWQT